jgi:hypothetical protein
MYTNFHGDYDLNQRLDEILIKIFEINPNYKIKYYDDYVSNNDVLVAYIEKKQCIHKYLNICKTNPQPPGFGDFLRGSIALYNFSKLKLLHKKK